MTVKNSHSWEFICFTFLVLVPWAISTVREVVNHTSITGVQPLWTDFVSEWPNDPMVHPNTKDESPSLKPEFPESVPCKLARVPEWEFQHVGPSLCKKDIVSSSRCNNGKVQLRNRCVLKTTAYQYQLHMFFEPLHRVFGNNAKFYVSREFTRWIQNYTATKSTNINKLCKPYNRFQLYIATQTQPNTSSNHSPPHPNLDSAASHRRAANLEPLELFEPLKPLETT